MGFNFLLFFVDRKSSQNFKIKIRFLFKEVIMKIANLSPFWFKCYIIMLYCNAWPMHYLILRLWLLLFKAVFNFISQSMGVLGI